MIHNDTHRLGCQIIANLKNKMQISRNYAPKALSIATFRISEVTPS